MIQFLATALMAFWMHPMHLGLVEIKLNDEANWEIELRLFADDLELAVRQNYGPGKLDILDESRYEDQKQWVEKYVGERFYLMIDSERMQPVFLGYQIDDIRCVIRMEVEVEYSDSVWEIHNSLLTDLFADQKNLVQILGRDGFGESALMDRSKTKVEIEI